MSRSGSALICIGGVDPSGGAGLVRDAWTIEQLDEQLARGFVVSAWTWQGRGEPARVRARPAEMFTSDLERALRRFDPAQTWIKIGLLPESLVPAVQASLVRHAPAGVVLDPVLRASDGGELGARPSSLSILFELCSVVTPNAFESEALSWSSNEPGLPTAVLFKGVAAPEGRVRDRLVAEGTSVDFERARVLGPDPRGTGCALATAIGLHCAGGSTLQSACEEAIAWLDRRRSQTRPGPDGRAHMS